MTGVETEFRFVKFPFGEILRNRDLFTHLRRYTNSPNTIGNAWGSQLMRLPASYMF